MRTTSALRVGIDKRAHVKGFIQHAEQSGGLAAQEYVESGTDHVDLQTIGIPCNDFERRVPLFSCKRRAIQFVKPL